MPIPKTASSGGPRTEAGRQALAHNALRVGACASPVVFPGEDPAHFYDVESQYLRDFVPINLAESAHHCPSLEASLNYANQTNFY